MWSRPCTNRKNEPYIWFLPPHITHHQPVLSFFATHTNISFSIIVFPKQHNMSYPFINNPNSQQGNYSNQIPFVVLFPLWVPQANPSLFNLIHPYRMYTNPFHFNGFYPPAPSANAPIFETGMNGYAQNTLQGSGIGQQYGQRQTIDQVPNL